MTRTFSDANGNEWTLALDAFTLRDIREETGANLADDGLFRVENDEELFVRVLLVILKDQIKSAKDFARGITGDVFDAARAALLEAASDFFPSKRWSAIQSICAKLRDADQKYQELRPLMGMLKQPDMPEALQNAVMGALGGIMEQAAITDSAALPGEASAPGQDTSQAKPASDSPDSSASAPAA